MSTISTLTSSDLAVAFHIEQASHAFPWSAKTFASNHGERYLNLKLCLSEKPEKMIGYAITQVVLDEATLFNLTIDPAYQGQGYGRQLLSHLIEQVEARGILTLWLEVRCSNLRAIHLYQDMGFNQVAIRRDYYPSAQGREDAMNMALALG